MGYRSQVVLAIHKNIMGAFLAHISQSPSTKALCFTGADEVVEHYQESGNFLFRWDGIKWYKGYSEVDHLTDFMDKCDDEESGLDDLGYRFVRIGEGEEDNEARGDGFNIYTLRTISY